MYEDYHHEYHEAKAKDFLYYLDRSDLNIREISESLDLNYEWIRKVKYGEIKKPNELRVDTVIDFIKDFERLQTYYRALLK